ncbi:MAG TPA: adenylyl-sulfate kinase [Acidimicrobiales bacterium]|nr:adenylyl-sulfate kinase [Acidimicrobiales bacterium]
MSRLSGGRTIWFTGLPSSGKTTLASAMAGRLAAEGYPVELLDGDVVRTHLTKDLGFSREDRATNVRRIGFVAHLLSRNGVVAVCALISPYQEDRDYVRALHNGRFFEVHVATPVEVCAERDVKGLYAKQRSGSMQGLSGIDDPYEVPLAPEVVVQAHRQTVEESTEQIWQALTGS